MFFSSFSDEWIRISPVTIEIVIVKKPNVNIFQVSVIPPNIEDNTTAVVIYLDISISHLPNSCFLGQRYALYSVPPNVGRIFLLFFLYRPQMVFIDHRLTQIGTDYEPKALIRMIIDYWLMIIICDNHNIFRYLKNLC